MAARTDKKENVINTPELRIHNNILEWSESMLQLSNVAVVSRVPLDSIPFPWWCLVSGFLGLFIFKEAVWIGLLLLCVAAAGIYIWYKKSEERKQQKNLIITMNSGSVMIFTFQNKAFLESVIKVLREIIANGNDQGADITINIKDNVITGNASVLNDMKM